MIKFITSLFSGVSTKLMLGIGAGLMALGLVYAIVSTVDDIAEDNQKAGRTEQVAKQLEETLETTEEVKEVRDEVESIVERGGTDERLSAECLRNDRNRAACN